MPIHCASISVTKNLIGKMFRFAVLVSFLALVCADPSDRNPGAEPASVNVVVVNSIGEYLADNLGIGILEQLERDEIQDGHKIKYTLGQHVDGGLL